MHPRIISILLLLSTLLAACGQAAPAVAPTQPAGDVTPVFAFSEAVVGRNRVALGLIRAGTPVNDPGAQVKLRFFDSADTSATAKAEADATYFGQGLPAAVYIAYPQLDRAGDWIVEVQTRLSGQTAPSSRKLRLKVLETSAVPNIASPAVAVKTPTVASVNDQAQLSSGTKPNPALYQISLDDALKSGKPTAVLFATPAFCRTAVCGPSLEVLTALQARYGTQMNMIHVEVYRYPFAESFEKLEKAAAANQVTEAVLRDVFSDGMAAWGLASEPWLYLIDKNGTIQARFEGGITQEEVGPMIEKIIAGKPAL